MVIAGHKEAGDAAAHTSNTKRLIHLLVQDLVHEVLDNDIKIDRVLLAVGLERQLGLGKGRVCDAGKEGPRLVLISLFCQG